MAVEKMKMMNVVAEIEHLDQILKKIVLSRKVHVVNALHEIEDSIFTLCMNEENMDEIEQMCEIMPYQSEKELRPLKDELSEIIKVMNMNETFQAGHFEEVYDYGMLSDRINVLYEKFEFIRVRSLEIEEELEMLRKQLIIGNIEKVHFDLKRAYESGYFRMQFGVLSNENRLKLVKNYENISAVVSHIGQFEGDEAIMVVSPKSLMTETDRILRSVHFDEIELVQEYISTPENMMVTINRRIGKLEYELRKLDKQRNSFEASYGEEILKCYSRLLMEEKIEKLKVNVAVTRKFFYLSGWVPESYRHFLLEELKSEGDVLVEFKEKEEVSAVIVPPTKLSNGRFMKPFETLVEMYGTPSYDELDPTMFLGISYMVLFGAMFGDLGQGMVLALAGMFFAKKLANANYGKLLTRLGLSSMVFGFFYDSFFGYEHVISGFVGRLAGSSHLAEAIFIRPIENINEILMVSVMLGVVLLLISFGYSIINKLKVQDYKEGIFGRNGIAGLILYMALLTMVLQMVIDRSIVPSAILGILILGGIVSIIFREPIANLTLKRRPLHHESAREYYVESGFDIFETFLGMLSNTISFIRVGAFALNHVGLFIAFHTMANIIGTFAGDVTMFFIGNLIVIFLEGLIVFIQGLRLVYYEMFSKYYRGDGKLFEPAHIK